MITTDRPQAYYKHVKASEFADAVTNPGFVNSDHLIFVPDAKNLPGFSLSLSDDILMNDKMLVKRLFGKNKEEVTLRRYNAIGKVSRL